MCSWHKQFPHVIGIGPQCRLRLAKKLMGVMFVCANFSFHFCLFVNFVFFRLWLISAFQLCAKVLTYALGIVSACFCNVFVRV